MKVWGFTKEVSWLWSAASVLFLLSLLASPASGSGQVELIQLISPRQARKFLQTIDYSRYEATRINIAEEESWEDPAIYLDLKGDQWKVEFPNDTFLSLDRFFRGDIANPRPVKGDLKKAALELLDRYLVYVYRVRIGGPETPDRAIILTPYSIRAFYQGNTIIVRLDDNGLQTREGELTDGAEIAF